MPSSFGFGEQNILIGEPPGDALTQHWQQWGPGGPSFLPGAAASCQPRALRMEEPVFVQLCCLSAACR